MIFKTTEKGQALILIALAAVGLFAFAALAIDGSRMYSDKRHAQNAADTASLAGALAYSRASEADKANETTINNIISTAAQGRSTSNSYNNNITSNIVTITAVDVPEGECGETDGKDITVKIVSYVDTTFARVIGRKQVTNAVTATARACGYYETPPFNGNPIVGLGDTNDTHKCPTDSKEGNWIISGGGVFSNGCANFEKVLLLDEGDCVTSVGDVDDIPDDICYHQDQVPQKIRYPEDVEKIMPPNPCVPGGIGIYPSPGVYTFSNGVYCISDLDPYDKKDIVLNHATLYVTDTSFRLQFTGHGSMSGTATVAGAYPGSVPYNGYFLIIAMYNDGDKSPCTDYTQGDQAITIAGNSGQTLTGTILAPSACVDLRGTSEGTAMNSQVIAHTVTSNGAGEVNINYDPDDNPKVPIQPSISQWK
jgi:Flp pilus assembly protein TadG